MSQFGKGHIYPQQRADVGVYAAAKTCGVVAARARITASPPRATLEPPPPAIVLLKRHGAAATMNDTEKAERDILGALHSPDGTRRRRWRRKKGGRREEGEEIVT